MRTGQACLVLTVNEQEVKETSPGRMSKYAAPNFALFESNVVFVKNIGPLVPSDAKAAPLDSAEFACAHTEHTRARSF